MGESTQDASLRPVVATISREMSRLAGGRPSETRTGIGELLESWAELVELRRWGQPPEMRECPVCGHRGMRAATRCGFCWTMLSPLARCEDEQATARTSDGG